MTSSRRVLLLFAAVWLLLCRGVPVRAAVDADWTARQTPFRIAGNLYYVGSRDLAVYLITTTQGNILINANLESSPPQIRASVEALGFRWADTRILLNSQAHFDHSAGRAAILRETGAKLVVMEGDAEVFARGGHDDFAGTSLPRFPAAPVSRVLHDGDTVRLGDTVLVAHKTAGHTRGCTTWALQVVDQGRTRDVVIVGGYAVLDSYRLIDRPGRPASYPGIAEDFERGFAVMRGLHCDIFLGAHGSYFGMQEKLKRMPREGTAVWVDPAGYQRLVLDGEKDFKARLESERRRIGPAGD